MANPWDSDPIVQAAPPAAVPSPQPAADTGTSRAMPWDSDLVVGNVEQQDSGQPPPPQDTIARRLGLGVRDVVQGIAGPLYDVAGVPFRAAGLPVRSLSENLTALGLPQSETSSERLASAIIQPAAGVLTGQGIGRAMTTAASPVVQGVGEALQAQPVVQAVSAGTGGAVQEETGSPTAGLVASLAVPGAIVAKRAIVPDILAGQTPERAAMLATAQQEGIPVSLAQMTGGRVARNLETTLAQLPGSSGAQAAFNDAQQQAFTRAVLGRAGVNSTVATPDVLNAGRTALWDQAQPIIQRNALRADPQLATDLQSVHDDVSRYADKSIQAPLLARVEDAINGITSNNGAMPGRSYQEMDSAIGREIRNSTNGTFRGYLGDLRDALRGAWDRSISPEDQAAWQDWRQKYANLQVVARAMDRPSEGTAAGQISPAALAQASRNTGSKSFAFGQGAYDDLARLGQGVLKPTIPDSGTAQRTMMTNLLQGRSTMAALGMAGVTQNPLFLAAPAAEIGLPRLTAAAYHSQWLRNLLTEPQSPLNALMTGAVVGGQNQARRFIGENDQR